jgi:hypothetical protein
VSVQTVLVNNPVVAIGGPPHLSPSDVSVANDPNGHAIKLATDSSGNLKCSVSGAGSGGTSSVDEASFTAGTTAGTPVMAYNPVDGVVYVCETADSAGSRVLAVSGTFSSTPPSSNSCSTNALNSISSTSAQVLPTNGSRKWAFLQNESNQPAFVLLGTGTASATNHTFILPACGTAQDGSSKPAELYIDWTGPIQVYYANSGGSFNAQELS